MITVLCALYIDTSTSMLYNCSHILCTVIRIRSVIPQYTQNTIYDGELSLNVGSYFATIRMRNKYQ